MGLDMYAQKVKKGVITESVDFEVAENVEQDELHYWRKHPNLHGWMENLYRRKGGQADVFNCVNVQLTNEDLNALEKVVKRNALPPTQGFFFGSSSPEDKEGDLQFIQEARRAIDDGFDVFYTSWW